MNGECKFCTEPLPMKALHFSNSLDCSWICLSMDLGHEKVLALLNRERVQKVNEA